MPARSPLSLQKDPDASAAPGLGMWGLGVGVCLGLVAWEYFALHGYGLAQLADQPVYYSTHILLDFVLTLPLVLLALFAGKSFWRRFDRLKQNWQGLLTSAAGVSLLILLLAIPAGAGRVVAHQALDSRFPPVLSGAGAAQFRGNSFCTFGRQEGRSDETEAEAGTALIGLAQQGLRSALLDQVAVVPMLIIGFSLILPRRRRFSLVATVRELSSNARAGLIGPLKQWTGIGATEVLGDSGVATRSSGFVFQRAVVGIPAAVVALILVPWWVIQGCGLLPKLPSPPPPETPRTVRTFNVSAIPISMTLNRFGDHDENAFMYVLDENIPAVREQESTELPNRVSTGLRKDMIQPLVLRANLGDRVVIHFTNRLTDGLCSMHIHGLSHTVESAGAAVGFNEDTSAEPGGSITYILDLPDDPSAERAYYFHDFGASRQRVTHGLFGALVAEPAGSVYYDPETGGALADSGWQAVIDPPDQPAFREFVIMYHEVGDENFDGIKDANGKTLPIIDETTGTYRPASRAINYRSEPFSNRMKLKFDKSQGYGSYMFGDPATPTPRSYLGEPTKTRLLHGGSEVFHVHHLHGGGDRWRRNPKADPNNDISSGLTKKPKQKIFSTHVDSQSIGPGTSYNLEHECGAGGCQQAAADFLYHCHIGHHYLAGMWSFWRVFDTLQEDLAPLPDRAPPPPGVTSDQLLGLIVEGKELVSKGELTDPDTQRSIEDWIESLLPPQGERLDDGDATVWDWEKEYNDDGAPVYLGEPEDTEVWANFASESAGDRPAIMFNPVNGRYSWPLLRPHLGKRPPFSPNGHTGAPWLGEYGTALRPDGLWPDNDVVPNPNQKIRQYPITAISMPIPMSATEVDDHGMIFVLGDEKDAVLSGAKAATPLAIRSNVGDGVHVLLTSELVGHTEELRSEMVDGVNTYSKVNMHIHFVQFDPQASDGVITGFAYEQSVRPYVTESRFLDAGASAGDIEISVNHVDRLREGIWIGIGLGEGMCGDVMCTEVRKIAAIDGTTITLDEPLELRHSADEAVGVEFVRYAWYSDVDTGTVFWHDHVNFKTWDHGLFGAHIIEPAGSTYHDPATGNEVRSGPIADIHAPADASIGAGQEGSFREFVLFQHNRTAGGFGENLGETGASINLRAAPLADREGDPAYVFSSVTHGDPLTPLPQAYVGDPFVIRHVGVVERVGGIRVTGHRFRLERWAEDGALSDTSPLGISERFDLVFDGGAGGIQGKAGDYLYYSSVAREIVAGAWGIIRVHGSGQAGLQALPGRTPPTSEDGFPQQSFTGAAPQKADGAGEVCPPDAPVRSYHVEVSDAWIVTSDNPVALHKGVAFLSLDEGTEPPARVNGTPIVYEPLVLRVNVGECLEVNLTNNLSEKASLSAGELPFDPQGSYGSAIGFNLDSTVDPGETRLCRFYADKELGTTFALNLANPDTLHQGAFAAVIVEPEGATYLDPYTGDPIKTGICADIESPSGSFREFVALFHDSDKVIGQSRMPYPENVEGFAGISYGSEPFRNRDAAGAPAEVFDSSRHGDPRAVIEAHPGDPVTFRVAAPWAEQMHVFSIGGHRWDLEPGMQGSEQVFSRLLAPGYSFDAPLIGGAGGDSAAAGDYLFLDHRLPFCESGLWGILAVNEKSDATNLRQLGGEQPETWKHSGRGRGAPRADLAEIIAVIEATENVEESPITVHTKFASVASHELGALRVAVTLPLRKGWVNSLDNRVWFVLSESSDQEFAEEQGVIWSRALAEAHPDALEDASFENGVWTFDQDPGLIARVYEGGDVPEGAAFWDADGDGELTIGDVLGPTANPGYSPLKRITWNGREIIVNAPMVKWGEESGQQMHIDPGGCDPLIRINAPSPFFVGNGPGGCTADEEPMARYEGGQVLSLDIDPDCENRIDTRQCASVTMKGQIAIHREDIFSYYVVFDASKPPPAGFMGVPHAPKTANLSPATTELFNVNAGASKAVGHIMQFRNGVFISDGGPKRFQPGLTSYAGPMVNDYSPMWHITWLFWDCNENGVFYSEDKNISFGAAPAPGSGIAGFDPADPSSFSPFGMEDRGMECADFAIQGTGRADGFVFVDKLEHLKEHGWVEETQAPDGWTGFIGGTPPLQAPLIVNCPTHVSVDLRDK